MANLLPHEKIVFEKIFDVDSGFLGFSHRTLNVFFADYGIDIEDVKYLNHIDKSTSKANKLRMFWKLESDHTVARINRGLLDYKNAIETTDKTTDKITDLQQEAEVILQRLEGKKVKGIEKPPLSKISPIEEIESTKAETSEIPITKITAPKAVETIIQSYGYLILRDLKQNSNKIITAKDLLDHQIMKEVRASLERHSEKLDFCAAGSRGSERRVKEMLDQLIKMH